MVRLMSLRNHWILQNFVVRVECIENRNVSGKVDWSRRIEEVLMSVEANCVLKWMDLSVWMQREEGYRSHLSSQTLDLQTYRFGKWTVESERCL